MKLQEILNKYRIEYEEYSDRLKINGSCCCNDSMDKIVYYFNSNRVICFKCGYKEKVEQFIKDKITKENINIDYKDSSTINSNKVTVKPKINITELYIKNTEPLPTGGLEYLVKEHINYATQRAANIRLHSNGFCIPQYNINNQLKGVKARFFNRDTKYLPLMVKDTILKLNDKKYLYGEQFFNIFRGGPLYLFEAEKSVLQFFCSGEPGYALAIQGLSLNASKIQTILRLVINYNIQEIVIAIDKMEQSEFDKHILNIYNKLKGITIVSYLPNLTKIDLKDSPTDKGKEIFKQIIEKKEII